MNTMNTTEDNTELYARWYPRGVSHASGLRCLVTNKRSGNGVMASLSGMSPTDDDHARVLQIFNGLASTGKSGLDIQVGVTHDNRIVLEVLCTLVIENGNVLTPEIIAQAKSKPRQLVNV